FTLHAHALDLPLRSGTVLDAKFEWNFGDGGGKYNKLTGFNAAHVYENSGQYKVTLNWRDASGPRDPISFEVNVLPDKRRKIFVSADGHDGNAGESPEKPIKSWDHLKRIVDDDTEILFRRGDRFDVSSPLELKS